VIGGAAQRAVFVTGAAGFIGSALCERLRSLGHRVIGYDDLSRGRREYLRPDVELIEGDIRDAARLQRAVSGSKPDWLIHLAAMHFIPDCIARPQETIDVNVEGTRQVLGACRVSSVRHFVFASSAAVYAPSDRPCIEDATPLGPLEVYGESKLAAEELTAAFHTQTGISTSVLRLFNAVGRNETNPHVVPHIFESLQASDVISLGDTAPCRDYVDTRDVAEAIVTVAAGSSGFSLFNVGTGTSHSVQDIVELLGRILRRPITVVREARRVRASERMLLVADLERISRTTGWTARFTLEDTLSDLATAYRLHGETQSSI
jgi:UDP-glucose 4-epimerase